MEKGNGGTQAVSDAAAGIIIQGKADASRGLAIFRAMESERPDALFKDPYARGLGGERGEAVARVIASVNPHTWSFPVRAHIVDQLIMEEVGRGVDAVYNLGGGLDSRPYRLDLPSSLRWIDVDLPELLQHRAAVVADRTAACEAERLELNLADGEARLELIERIRSERGRTLIVAEGSMIFFDRDEVASMARGLAGSGAPRRWIFDLFSPGLLENLRNGFGRFLADAGAPLRFGPEEGPGFFHAHGWRTVEIRTILRHAARARRVPFFMRLLALLPERNGRQGERAWAAVCLMETEG